MSVVFVFFEKIFECQTKIDKKKYDDNVLSRIKGVDEKTYHVENDQKKKKNLRKNACLNKG